MNAIEASNLGKTYKGGVRALDGLSFSVETGTIFALLGPNGAGKSTAVRILTTLSRADRGQARVGGLDVVRDAVAVRRTIGVVGQKPGLDPEATGRENLELQAELHGIHSRARRDRVDRLLDRLGLAEVSGRLAKTYSGGMQRRLDVGLGLVHRPTVLFLDEPTTGLDPEVRVEMWREVERLTLEEEMTILLTTHYLEEADRLASRLVIVDRGRVAAEGSPDELKRELQGDTVQVELAEAGDDAAAATVRRLSGISEVTMDGRTLRARADDGAAAIPALISTLEQDGLRVAAATIARPSLDDVYLRHTGRSLRQAETEEVAA